MRHRQRGAPSEEKGCLTFKLKSEEAKGGQCLKAPGREMVGGAREGEERENWLMGGAGQWLVAGALQAGALWVSICSEKPPEG